MTSSIAEVISVHAGDVTSAETADATSTEATDAASAETADVTSAEATHMASTKAAHMASTAATSMATATATAGLRVSGKKAAGKHCACQNHHHSSSHDILLWNRRDYPPQVVSDAGMSAEGKRQRRDGLEMGMLVSCFY